MSLELRLSRPDRTYRLGEMVVGVVSWAASSPTAVSSVTLHASGVVKPTLDPRSVGIFEALYSSLKPIDIMSATIDMVTPAAGSAVGAVAATLPREVALPFAFPVEASPGGTLTET
jgi:hypothetical protein